jgi:hypothetical protein
MYESWLFIHCRNEEQYVGGNPVVEHGEIVSNLVPVSAFIGMLSRPIKEKYYESEISRGEDGEYNIRTEDHYKASIVRSGDMILNIVDEGYDELDDSLDLNTVFFTTNPELIDDQTFLVEVYEVNYVKKEKQPFDSGWWYTRINIKNSTTPLYGKLR